MRAPDVGLNLLEEHSMTNSEAERYQLRTIAVTAKQICLRDHYQLSRNLNQAGRGLPISFPPRFFALRCFDLLGLEA